MKKIVEKTLDAALIKASMELQCSVVDLEYEVIQHSSNGFLGIGKKDAIIIVDTKVKSSKSPKSYAKQEPTPTKKAPNKDFVKDKKPQTDIESSPAMTFQGHGWGENTDLFDEASLQSATLTLKTPNVSQDDASNVAQIRSEIIDLFARLPFEIDCFEVRLEDDNTLFVYINGKDCALLIGERGYRYKALSYLLFNWINPKYGYSLRLEIAEFLKNQEEMIDVYLKELARTIKANGKAQTKTLDGILVYIALNKLRAMFPDKYISVRQNETDEKYIIINDFRR